VQAACYIDVLPLRAKRVLEVCMYGNSNGSTVDGVGISVLGVGNDLLYIRHISRLFSLPSPNC